MTGLELMFPCERCGQTIRTGVMLEPGATDSSAVGSLVECTHCGQMNAIELDHLWRARQAVLEASKRGSR